MELTVNKLL